MANENVQNPRPRRKLSPAARRARRRRRRLRQIRNIAIFAAICLLLLFLVISGIRAIIGLVKGGDEAEKSGADTVQETLLEGEETLSGEESGDGEASGDASAAESSSEETTPAETAPVLSFESTIPKPAFFAGYTPQGAGVPITIGEVGSTYGVLIDMDTGTVVAGREADTVINPASMTKILTVLVAAEHVTNPDDLVVMSQETMDYIYKNDCSTAGFALGEAVPVRDLFYGTALPSGADAALSLAEYVAGSQEAFVALMNQKVQELGLAGTAHFSNCIGLYSEENHCTVKDMAMILKAAVENDFAREILSAHTWTTTATPEHPEGIILSNWFLRRIEDKEFHGTVMSAKTGYVKQSGSCAASWEVSDSGKNYICVTGNAHSSWRCIYDHVAIYRDLAP
ncbi:MAG: D-alanyl-D-alanine carboxypeptidase [Clostridium sp.]|nr:D-alanyl-D-alanine carboxypeptidase [Clostridium sp.]MBP3215385.1 D-alanyl-D-alanine carboxypeptidase [Clostridium sp.]